jgi:signal transduction histidine kinase
MTNASISKTTKAANKAEAYEIAKSLPPHLLEPWRTKRGAVKATLWSAGLVLAAFCTEFTLHLKTAEPVGYPRILMTIGAVVIVCAFYNAPVWWQTQRLRAEPTLGTAGAILWLLTLVLPSALLFLRPRIFASGPVAEKGAIELVFALVLLTGLVLFICSLFYLLGQHTRLSARDAERERRLTQRSDGYWLRLNNKLTNLPLIRPLNAYSAVEMRVDARTQLFDLWSGRNARALILRDTMGAVALLMLVLTVMWFIVTHDGERYEVGVLPYVRLTLSLVVVMGAGHATLACLRCFLPWAQNAMVIYVLLLIAAQVNALVMSVLLVRGDFPAGLPKLTVFIYLLLANGYAFFSLISLLLKRFKQISEARTIAAAQKRAIAESERARALAELKSLQAQIEPHFIYNTLANLQSLIRQEMPPSPEGKTSASDVMTGHLIDYLRARTLTMRDTVAPLSKEIEMTESYLRLMQIRMGERLNYTIDIAEAARDVPIPPLSIMSLVENSIKHGLEPKRGSVSVAITAAIEQDNLRVTIADTGRGFSADASGTGVGLSNLKERLALMYGGDAELTLSENNPTGVIAALMMPLNTNSNITSI